MHLVKGEIHRSLKVKMDGSDQSSVRKRIRSEDDILGDSDESCSIAAKISAREYAPSRSAENVSSGATYPDGNSLKVLVTGTGRPMRQYHPTAVNSAIFHLVGSSKEIRMLNSGDLLISCVNGSQVKKLLECDTLTHAKANIPIKTSVFSPKPPTSRAVISGVPIDISEDELLDGFKSYKVSYVKRFRRKTEDGFQPCQAVLLNFASPTVPRFLTFAYLRFQTRAYNPPPTRCYNCNRFGHTAVKCRGKHSCTKCGGSDHKSGDCKNDVKCLNCNKPHSAAYAGCPKYKEEARVQIIKERNQVSYSEAKETLRRDNPSPIAPDVNNVQTRELAYSQVLRDGKRNTSRIAMPFTNDADLRYFVPRINQSCENEPTSRETPVQVRNSTSDMSASIAQLDPIRLLALVAEIVQLTVTACKDGNSNVFIK